MKIVHGDLLDLALAGAFDVIVHGCNCRCIMGAGIARQIRERFPEAYQVDLAYARLDLDRLGHISCAPVERMVNISRDGLDEALLRRFVVVNAYTQPEPGACVSYEAIVDVFNEIADEFAGLRIGYPRIGAGLGGGDWGVIGPIIEEILEGEDHTLVEWQRRPS